LKVSMHFLPKRRKELLLLSHVEWRYCTTTSFHNSSTKSYAGVLTQSTTACELFGGSIYRNKQIKMRLVEWPLIQHKFSI
jgi:hypothetical protein